MKIIKFNGATHKIYADLENALCILRGENFVTLKSTFTTGPVKWQKNLIANLSKAELELGGISVNYADKTSDDPIIRRFSEEHPRAHYVIAGNKRRVNAILKKLEAAA